MMVLVLFLSDQRFFNFIHNSRQNSAGVRKTVDLSFLLTGEYLFLPMFNLHSLIINYLSLIFIFVLHFYFCRRCGSIWITDNPTLTLSFTYRVFIKYCVFLFFILYFIYIFLCFLSVTVCVHTPGNRTPALQQNWQGSEKSKIFKEKHNI